MRYNTLPHSVCLLYCRALLAQEVVELSACESKERDCLYYITVQTNEVEVHFRRHAIEFDAVRRLGLETLKNCKN